MVMYIYFSFARVALVHSPCVRYALLFLGRCRLLPCNCYRCCWWWFWSARWSAVLSINSGWGRLMRTPSVTGEQDHVRCWCVNTQRASRTSSGKTEYEKTKRISIADNRCSVQSWQDRFGANQFHSQRKPQRDTNVLGSLLQEPGWGCTHAQTLAWPALLSLSWCLTISVCAALSTLLTSASAVSMAWLVRSRFERGDGDWGCAKSWMSDGRLVVTKTGPRRLLLVT